MKLNYKRTVLIGLAFLSICAFWQMYDSIIPLILQNTFGIGETLTGAIMAADNVLAIFLLPLFGALSDKTDIRFGRRMPFIVTGTVLAVIFLMLLPIADRQVNIVLFIVSLFALLVSMGLYRSPAVALMPDLTPNKLRSKGNAIINLMGAVGGVYTLIMIKLLVGKGDRPDYMPLFVSVAALMVISVGILVITISEKKIEAKVAAEIKAYEDSTGPDTFHGHLSAHQRYPFHLAFQIVSSVKMHQFPVTAHQIQIHGSNFCQYDRIGSLIYEFYATGNDISFFPHTIV